MIKINSPKQILTISNTNPILKINPNKDNINDKDNLHKCAIMWCPHHNYSFFLLVSNMGLHYLTNLVTHMWEFQLFKYNIEFKINYTTSWIYANDLQKNYILNFIFWINLIEWFYTMNL